MVGSSTRDSPFVGRQREMAELTQALDDAISGCGRVVMLAGEPGIGKTRLSQELAALAQHRGAPVLWGRCHQQQGAPPYWPWIQPIRAYVQQADPDALLSQMGPGAAEIAEIVPEIRSKIPDLEPPPPQEPEYARFRLFDSITTFLKNASSATGGLLVILEDLHWADRSSLMLLEFAASEIASSRLLVLGSYRDMEVSHRHPLSETLGRLARNQSFSRVQLFGLARQEVGSLLEAASGVMPSPGVVESIHERTEGNPLFVTQIARLMSREGGSWSGSIPQAVMDAIGERLNRLSVECNEALTVASVIGRDFDFGLLEQVTGSPNEELLDVIEEALEAHVLEAAAGRMERYQFSHALIQQTLYERLSPTRRVRLHARIGETLEELYAANVEAHATELAHHFGEAEAVLGQEKLVRYSAVAGERALGAYAYENALAHFQRALDARVEGPVDMEMAALLFGLGRVQLATIDPREYQEALTNLTRAFDYYAEVGDVPRAVAVAQSPVQSSLLAGRRTGVFELLARALALVPPDSHEAGQLLCQYGNTLYYETGDYDGALKALVQALSIAQREEDAALEMRTLVAAGHAEAAHLHFQESLGYDLRAIELASSVDEPFEETHAQQEVAAVLHRTGDLEGARRYAAATLSVAERLRQRTRLWQALQINTVVSSLEGDWETARSLSNRALALSPRNPNLLGYRALIEYTVGDFDQGGAYLERLLEAMQRTAPGPTLEYAFPAIVIPLAAHLSNFDNRLEVVETAAHAVLSSSWVTPVFAGLARAGLALLAVRREDAATSEEQYGALYSRRGAMLGGFLDSIISADRLLGLLAQTIGRLDQMVVHFEDALAFCRKAGYRPELAWTCYDYANLLHERGQRLRALSSLDEALAISTELGMKPLMEKVIALKDQVEAQQAKAPEYPGGLTEREVEVLRLVASGRSNAEIADKLVLSARTIERHISNIYSKTNTHGRAEATAFAFTHGLIPSNRTT